MPVAYIDAWETGTKTRLDAFVDDINSNIATTSPARASVRLATTAALPAHTRNATTGVLTASANGALTIDSVAVAAGDRVLVKNEADTADNLPGASIEHIVYTVTNAGSATTAFVLTPATDFNATADIAAGAFVPVDQGTINNEKVWYISTDAPYVWGTTALRWHQIPTVTIANEFEILSHAGTSDTAYKVTTRSLRTTDATVTNLWSLTIADASVVSIRAYVTVRQDGGQRSAYFAREFAVKRQESIAAGARTLVRGATAFDATDYTSASDYRSTATNGFSAFATAAGPSLDFSGNDVRLRITGEAGTNYDWYAVIEYQAAAVGV